MSRDNFSARERVAHKLSGAAYQMTFVEEYDMAMQTMSQAIEFWEETRDEPLSAEEAAEMYQSDSNLDAVADGDGRVFEEVPRKTPVKVPNRGTNRRDVVNGLLTAHDHGEEWVHWDDLTDYGVSERKARQVSTFVDEFDWFDVDRGEGRYGDLNRYRINPQNVNRVREALKQ